MNIRMATPTRSSTRGERIGLESWGGTAWIAWTAPGSDDPLPSLVSPGRVRSVKLSDATTLRERLNISRLALSTPAPPSRCGRSLPSPARGRTAISASRSFPTSPFPGGGHRGCAGALPAGGGGRRHAADRAAHAWAARSQEPRVDHVAGQGAGRRRVRGGRFPARGAPPRGLRARRPRASRRRDAEHATRSTSTSRRWSPTCWWASTAPRHS